MRKVFFSFIIVFCLAVFSTSTAGVSKALNVEPAFTFYNYEDENHISPAYEDDVNAYDEVEIALSFAGDCTLGSEPSFSYQGSFDNVFDKNAGDFTYFFSGLSDTFTKDDLTTVNLECTLTTSEIPANKEYRFKGRPEYANILKQGSIEIVNIANNHIYDFLNKGFEDTLQNLKDAGLVYFGEDHIAYYSVKETVIAYLGYRAWNSDKKDMMASDIQEAKAKSDIVIVSMHWGDENSNYPNVIQTELGRFAVDMGADAVIGHHPHVIQGIELYKGRYIVYSLGNFCFGGNIAPWDRDTFVFRNTFSLKQKQITGINYEIIPCSVSSSESFNDYRPMKLDGDNGKMVISRIMDYSSTLQYGISDTEK